jgi:hypothetical protein
VIHIVRILQYVRRVTVVDYTQWKKLCFVYKSRDLKKKPYCDNMCSARDRALGHIICYIYLQYMQKVRFSPYSVKYVEVSQSFVVHFLCNEENDNQFV